MSVTCPDCGAVAGRGYELGHKSDCPSLKRGLRIQKMRFTNEWLRRRIEADPDDVDCEAGGPALPNGEREVES